MSLRERALSALFDQLRTMAVASVKCNEALPQAVPAAGLVILRDGDPGEPDVTLNPVHFYYRHQAEIEAFVTPLVGGGGEALLDTLIEAVADALAVDRSLGGLVENMSLGAPTIETLIIEGAAPIDGGLVLLQRGNGASRFNARIDLDLARALDGLDGRAALEPEALRGVQRVALGELAGVPLGFTDAAMQPDGCLLFAAAAEDTAPEPPEAEPVKVSLSRRLDLAAFAKEKGEGP